MFVVVYLRIYGQSLLSALAAIGRAPWTLLLPMGLANAMYFIGLLTAPMDIAGGFLTALARTAAFSIYTYFLAELVAKNRLSLTDLRTALGAYFWTWMNFFFVLWIIDFVLARALAQNPQRGQFMMIVAFMELVVLNAAPEIIYQRRTYGGLETISRSFEFLQENWVEWFIPNGLLLAGLFFLVTATGILSGAAGLLGTIGWLLVAGAALHVVMVARGFLFEVLVGSTHRQRMFRFRGKL